MAQHDDKETERRQRQLRKLAELDEHDVNEVVSVLLGSDKGNKFLWWLLQIGKVGLQPFTVDSHTTAFACGELNVGQQILARILEVNPVGYADMMLKRKNENERRDALLAGDPDPDSDDPAGS